MTFYSVPQRFKGLLVALFLVTSKAKMGGRLRIEGRLPRVENRGRMTLGRDIKFRTERLLRTVLKTGTEGVLEIGAGTYLNEGVSIAASKQITIGCRCLIGENVQIHDSDYHQLEQFASVKVLPIAIGDNVWIGRNVIILPGVSIGDHSVIGAGSVVTKSVPPRTVFAGVPARQIREIVADDGFIRR